MTRDRPLFVHRVSLNTLSFERTLSELEADNS